MSRKKQVHVVPHKGKWATKTAGAKRVGKTATTQKEAFATARQQMQRRGGEVVVHRPNGQIRAKHTYGKPDPFPPKG